MTKKNNTFIYALLIIFSIIFSINISKADTLDELQAKIDVANQNKSKLEAEIKKYQQELVKINTEATNLKNTISALNASTNKISSEVKLVETNINKTGYTIENTNLEIRDKERQINNGNEAIKSALRRINELDNNSLLEILLSNNDFGDFWTDLDDTIRVQSGIREQVRTVKNIKVDLEKANVALQKQKEELEAYNTELVGRKQSLQSTKKEKDNLLIATKNKESEYQKLVKEKEAQKKAFEDEILSIEESIKFLIDPSSYPSPSKGIFGWPLETLRITQEFGGTQFAKNNPGIYGRPYHPGVDFGTAIGSAVHSIGPGIVKGFDNTDAYKGCYAWGRWILVEHDNGLSSLYAHLSAISVVTGQRVTAGQVIGYSGNSGVSTGPHLHLSLYVTQGVEIAKYRDYRPGATGCAATNASGPFADLDAYLDPMSYLKSL